jgi:hypothetical protein
VCVCVCVYANVLDMVVWGMGVVTLAKRRGNTGKSTARMARLVMISMPARYKDKQDMVGAEKASSRARMGNSLTSFWLVCICSEEGEEGYGGS